MGLSERAFSRWMRVLGVYLIGGKRFIFCLKMNQHQNAEQTIKTANIIKCVQCKWTKIRRSTLMDGQWWVFFSCYCDCEPAECLNELFSVHMLVFICIQLRAINKHDFKHKYASVHSKTADSLLSCIYLISTRFFRAHTLALARRNEFDQYKRFVHFTRHRD